MLLGAYKKCDFTHLSFRLLSGDECGEGLHDAQKVAEALCKGRSWPQGQQCPGHEAVHKAEAHPELRRSW